MKQSAICALLDGALLDEDEYKRYLEFWAPHPEDDTSER